MRHSGSSSAWRSLTLCLALPALSIASDRAAGAATPVVPSIGCAGCTVLTGGTVFDGTRGGIGTVVIEGTRVRRVVFGEAHAIAGEVVDVTGQTVLPGLIDLHVHSTSSAGLWGSAFEQSVDDVLRAMLRAGVTTYLDLGSPARTIFDYRTRIGEGALLAPRLFASGPLLTATGGHPCYDDPPGDFCVFIDAPADVDAALDVLQPARPDFLKVVVEAGVSRPIPELSGPSLAAIEARAEAAGVRAIAHVSSTVEVEAALAGGVRLFAHLPFLDRISPDLAARMAAEGVVVVPTAAVVDSDYRLSHGTVVELDDPALGDDVPAEVVAELRSPAAVRSLTGARRRALTETWRETLQANVALCHQAGVRLAAGTDSGNPGVFHGLAMARELSLYVEAGMTPLEALTAGTRAPADLLRRSDLGRLEAGATADVLVVEGDALADIGALARVARVYLDGGLVDREALALPRKTRLER